MATNFNRRNVLQGAAALAPFLCGGMARADNQPVAVVLKNEGGKKVPYVGTSTSRIDGRAKVSGGAKYSAEYAQKDLAYGSIVQSTIAKGRIIRIDTSEAMRVAGVLDILTHEKRPRMADKDQDYKDDVAPDVGSPFRPLYDDRILFNGQPIALVLAEDWETANYAASLIRVEYHAEPHVTDIRKQRGKAFTVETPAKPRGDADKAYSASEVRHEAEYFIPIENHNPMELYATTVQWDGGGKLTVYDKTQGVQNVHKYLRGVFGLKEDDIKVMSPFMGGGFGSGLRPQYETVLGVLAAQALQRSVRVVLTRAQMYQVGYRAASIERLTIGANKDGTLNSISHEAIAMTSQYEDYYRNDTAWSGLLYKSSNATYVHKLVRMDYPTSCDMRAPGATTGVYALECAMDELAIALKIDPMELRLRCYSDLDQINNVPYTSKELRECYRQGAEAFGWSKRNPEPRSMRDGTELVGWGMATGVWEALQMPMAARIVLTANGHVEVASAPSDIGTGTYTIMAQVAADALGVPLENISIKLGDSSLPQSPVEGGSWIASSVSNAIAVTAEEVRNKLFDMAKQIPGSALADTRLEDVAFTNTTIVSKQDATRSVSFADAMRQGGVDRIEVEKTANPSQDKSHARNTHSAIFAEVKIDEQLGVIRVTRVVNAVAAGRVLNTKTAHSQMMGGVVWGIGMALHEETLVDHRYGRVMNANIAEYHVPVNADVHEIKIIFVEERDDLVNPLGIKGMGEIGIVGVAAAIANAVYHATGTRVRDLPITLDKILRA